MTNITTAIFDLPLRPQHITRFRAGIIENVLMLKEKFREAGINTELFHNRFEDKNFLQKHYRYPQIHYFVTNNKGSITAIGDGVKALQLLLDYRPEKIRFNNKQYSFVLQEKIEQQWIAEQQDKHTAYRMYKWLALNPDNYRKWEQTPRLTERVKMLEDCIHGHILQLLKSTDNDHLKPDVYLRSIGKEEWVKLHEKSKLAFDITFCCNINLPELIGIGQSPAHGYGKIRLLNQSKEMAEV